VPIRSRKTGTGQTGTEESAKPGPDKTEATTGVRHELVANPMATSDRTSASAIANDQKQVLIQPWWVKNKHGSLFGSL
jgi:hypothetical protein